MKKSIFRWGFVLCMLVGLLTIAASAAAPEAPECPAEHAGWTAISTVEGNVLPEGNYYLDEGDLELAEKLTASGNVTICLNGFDIISTAADYTLLIGEGCDVHVCNCSGADAVISATAGTAFAVSANAQLTLEKDVVFNGNGTASAIGLSNGAVLNLNGGKITNSSSYVQVGTNNVFNMYTGSEVSGSAKQGVLVTADGTFNMHGGTVKANSSCGVQLNKGGTFNMYEGASVTENKAARGAGVYVSDNNATFNMHGGTIIGNKGTNTKAAQACGLFIGGTAGDAENPKKGIVNIYGGEISGNLKSDGSAAYNVIISQGAYTQNDGTVSNLYIYLLGSKECALTFNGGTFGTINGSASHKSASSILINGGTFDYSKEALVETGWVNTKMPVTYEVVDAKVTKVTPGYEVTGENFDFKSSLNFGLTLGCDNGFVAKSVVATVNGDAVDATIVDGVVTVEATGITAKEIGAPIAFSVKGTDDTVYFEDEISVADIAKEQYAASEDAAFKTLMVDMIKYGNEAAAVFGGEQVALGGMVGSDELTQTWAHSENYGTASEHEMAATLSLKEKVQLNVYHKAEDGTVTKKTMDEIAVKNALAPVVVEFEDGCTASYSIADYVLDALEGEQADLISALQKYIDSVCAVCAEA